MYCACVGCSLSLSHTTDGGGGGWLPSAAGESNALPRPAPDDADAMDSDDAAARLAPAIALP